MSVKLESLNDRELLLKSRQGDDSAFAVLAERYTALIKSRINKVYTSSFDKDDLFQECMIIFFGCIFSFDEKRGDSFSAYIERAIDNRLVTALRHDKTEKNKPLADYISISDFEKNPMAELGRENDDPSLAYIKKEEIELMESRAKILLSRFEFKALELYLGGSSYEEMAQSLGTSVKSVDNALQRIRRKLKNNA